MASDQAPILGGDEIELDEIGTQFDAQRKGFQRMLGEIATGAAMGDHQRWVHTALVSVAGRGTERPEAQRTDDRRLDPSRRRHGASPGGRAKESSFNPFV